MTFRNIKGQLCPWTFGPENLEPLELLDPYSSVIGLGFDLVIALDYYLIIQSCIPQTTPIPSISTQVLCGLNQCL